VGVIELIELQSLTVLAEAHVASKRKLLRRGKVNVVLVFVGLWVGVRGVHDFREGQVAGRSGNRGTHRPIAAPIRIQTSRGLTDVQPPPRRGTVPPPAPLTVASRRLPPPLLAASICSQVIEVKEIFRRLIHGDGSGPVHRQLR